MAHIDPMQAMIEDVARRIATSTSAAQSDCVRVEVRADGKIEAVYLTDEASAMTPSGLATAIAQLAEQARTQAVAEVSEAMETLANDPRIIEAREIVERGMRRPMPEPTAAATTPGSAAHSAATYQYDEDDEDYARPTTWLVR